MDPTYRSFGSFYTAHLSLQVQNRLAPVVGYPVAGYLAAQVQRGDVVVVDFTPTMPAASVRPALVVQNDRDNARMRNTIVAQVTSNLRRAGEDNSC